MDWDDIIRRKTTQWKEQLGLDEEIAHVAEEGGTLSMDWFEPDADCAVGPLPLVEFDDELDAAAASKDISPISPTIPDSDHTILDAEPLDTHFEPPPVPQFISIEGDAWPLPADEVHESDASDATAKTMTETEIARTNKIQNDLAALAHARGDHLPRTGAANVPNVGWGGTQVVVDESRDDTVVDCVDNRRGSPEWVEERKKAWRTIEVAIRKEDILRRMTQMRRGCMFTEGGKPAEIEIAFRKRNWFDNIEREEAFFTKRQKRALNLQVSIKAQDRRRIKSHAPRISLWHPHTHAQTRLRTHTHTHTLSLSHGFAERKCSGQVVGERVLGAGGKDGRVGGEMEGCNVPLGVPPQASTPP